jgi:hypothetical protein
MTTTKLKIFMGEEVDILEVFFEALSTPKNNLTKEYLSGGMSDPRGKIEANE